MRERETWGFARENEGKNFDRGTTGDAKIEILRVGETDSLPDSLPIRTLPDMRMPKETWKRACSLYLAGMDWETIASKLGVNKTTLSKRASLEGLTKVKREMQTVCIQKKTESLESLSAIVRNRLAADAASTLERVDGYDLADLKDEATRETILNSVAKRSALVFGWSEAGESTSVSINLLGSMPDRFAEIQVHGAQAAGTV